MLEFGSQNLDLHIPDHVFFDIREITGRKGDGNEALRPIIARPAFELIEAKRLWVKDEVPLLELVDRFGNHNAAILHDKVYALLSLACDSDQITVDYRKTRRELSAEVLQVSGSASYTNVELSLVASLSTRILGDVLQI
jgi:hypothetical protein